MLDLRFLPPMARAAAADMQPWLREIRLRVNRPVQIIGGKGEVLGEIVGESEFAGIVARLMDYSLYAWEAELGRGFFTLPDGSRAGVCGVFTGERGAMRAISDIGSVCIRVAQEVIGCSDALADVFAAGSVLIISPPGMGKTTLLRDAARRLSADGKNVCLVDERGELAACRGGCPTLDIGPRTDVYSFIAKAEAMPMAVRALAPDVIITDELGARGDAEAALETVRCGVSLIASAHGSSLALDSMRGDIRRAIDMGAFKTGVLLGPAPGKIMAVDAFF